MNLEFPGIWIISDPPSMIESKEELGNTLLQFPVVGEQLYERAFAGSLKSLLQLIYEFYQELVSYAELSDLLIQEIRREPLGEEANRLSLLLGYSRMGAPITRLDILGLLDPRFIGIQEGVVILGS